MAITAPIAGAYTGTWNSNALLYTRQGFNISLTQKAEKIEETDLYGLSLIDMVYRGAQLMIDTICRVFGSGSYVPMFGWSGVFGQVYTAAKPIGQLASGAAKALVLTVVANTPAAVAAAPTTLTATTIISPDNNMQLVFNSTLREVPLRFDVLLVDSAGSGNLFSTT